MDQRQTNSKGYFTLQSKANGKLLTLVTSSRIILADPTWPDNDFLGYDPPPVTVYTGMTAGNYCWCFFAMLFVHILVLMFMKGRVSRDFRRLNLLDRLLHAAVSTNFPFAVNDWDLIKTDRLDEYHEKMR